MAILKRFICSKHGEFDAWTDARVRCPAAKCRCKPREMVSAPAVQGTKQGFDTRKADQTLKNLASDYGMTNMRSAKEGENQAGFHHHGQTSDAPPPGSGVLWGNQGGMNMESLLKGGQFRSVRGENVGVKPSDLGVNKGPTVASYVADHENLKIKP